MIIVLAFGLRASEELFSCDGIHVKPLCGYKLHQPIVYTHGIPAEAIPPLHSLIAKIPPVRDGNLKPSVK